MSDWANTHAVPKGYRFLNVGEKIEGTDLFCTNSGHGDPTNINDYVLVIKYAKNDIGDSIRSYHVAFIRKITTPKGNNYVHTTT